MQRDPYHRRTFSSVMQCHPCLMLLFMLLLVVPTTNTCAQDRTTTSIVPLQSGPLWNLYRSDSSYLKPVLPDPKSRRTDKDAQPVRGSRATIAASSHLNGVDVSHWQGTINWDNLKNSTDFAIIQASFGCPDPGQSVGDYTDSQFNRNQSEARRVGILRGFYHFAYPDYNDPEPEADQFVNAIGALQTGEVLCLDYERDSSKDPVDWCARWLDRVYSKTGVRPLLYIDYSRESSYDWSRVINGNYGLWLADWDGNADPESVGTSWPFVAIKQYADNGNVGGISRVDLDSFGGNAQQFMAYGKPSPKPPSVNWGGLSPNKWYGPADFNSQISWSLQDQGGGIGGLSQSWDTPITDTSPAFPNSNSGYVLFSYLPGGQQEGQHTAYVRAWTADHSAYSDSSQGWFGYDASAPTVTITSGQTAGATYYTPQNLKWHISDPLSGISMWGQAWDSDPGQQFNSSDGNLDLPMGTHTLHVHTWDNVGNNQDWTFGPYTLLSLPTVQTIAFSPADLVGGSGTTGTITLSANAPPGGVSVTLTTTDPGSAASVPTTVTVPGGQTSATFSVTTSTVKSPDAITVSANYNNSSTTGKFTIEPTTPTVKTLSFNPATVVGGKSSTGTVTLSGNAPSAGATINLKTTDPGSATTVPASVTIPSGQSSITFAVSTKAVPKQDIVTVTGTYNSSSATGQLTINASRLDVVGLTFTPTNVVGGKSTTGTVTLSGPAPAKGQTVTLKATDPKNASSVPASVNVPAGKSSATFTASTKSVTVSDAVTVTATFNGSTTGKFTIEPANPTVKTLSFSPADLVGGKSTVGTITLSGNAPSSGVTITLKTTDSKGATTVPASITVPSGKSSATFNVSTKSVSSPDTVTVTASYNNSSAAGKFTIEPTTPTVKGLSFNPAAVVGGKSTTGTVTLTGNAPSAGATITLTSTASATASAPLTVKVPAGQSTVSFTTQTHPVSTDTTVTFAAIYNGSSKATTLLVKHSP